MQATTKERLPWGISEGLRGAWRGKGLRGGRSPAKGSAARSHRERWGETQRVGRRKSPSCRLPGSLCVSQAGCRENNHKIKVKESSKGIRVEHRHPPRGRYGRVLYLRTGVDGSKVSLVSVKNEAQCDGGMEFFTHTAVPIQLTK